MKYLKMLGLAAVAACALMAFVGAETASATTLTCNGLTTCPAGTVIHDALKGHGILHPVIGDIECNVTLEGKLTNAGSSTTTVNGQTTSFSITNCTNGAKVQTLKTGRWNST